MAETGLFISVEGIDGAGKSTQAARLAARLGAAGHRVVETREPGGAPGAEEIRRLLVEGDPQRWSAETEILLFTAARRDNVERVIRPALEAGAVVVCDRYVDSTRAYQGMGGERLRALVEEVHALAIDLDPDLTLIFDLDPDAALARAGARATAAEARFEEKGIDFQKRLRAVYHRLAREEPRRIRLIDAEGDPDTVAERAWAAVVPALADP